MSGPACPTCFPLPGFRCIRQPRPAPARPSRRHSPAPCSKPKLKLATPPSSSFPTASCLSHVVFLVTDAFPRPMLPCCPESTFLRVYSVVSDALVNLPSADRPTLAHATTFEPGSSEPRPSTGPPWVGQHRKPLLQPLQSPSWADSVRPFHLDPSNTFGTSPTRLPATTISPTVGARQQA
ncbi:hypothetical protein MN608_04669 [Microdochium nivale]|nr:hypothetical protein MN608_04669 [Microdochium nivale]